MEKYRAIVRRQFGSGNGGRWEKKKEVVLANNCHERGADSEWGNGCTIWYSAGGMQGCLKWKTSN